MRSIDLHGLYIHDAWKQVAQFLNLCYYDNIKTCEVICGQGLIKTEIEEWLRLNTYVREYRISRTQGSYIVKLRKRKNQ